MASDIQRDLSNTEGKELPLSRAAASRAPTQARSLPKYRRVLADLGNRAALATGPGASDLRVGVDVVSVAEVGTALQQFGDRYVQRTFTPHEASYCRAGAPQVAAERFAARIAAKEAAIKALQPSVRWSDWRSIEVRRCSSGRCALHLHGTAATLAARRGIAYLALSMTHDGDVAAAVVVAVPSASRRKR